MTNRAGLLLCGALAAGCGGRSSVLVEESAPASEAADPVALFVEGEAGCGDELPVGDATRELTLEESGQGIAVVELFFQDECTGLGGQYILAREVDGEQRLWLGGHGCQFLPEPVSGWWRFGVLRYVITAALFQISPDVCVGFPDEAPGAATGNRTAAIAVFETLEDAQAFAEDLPEGPP